MMVACADNIGLCLPEFADCKALPNELIAIVKVKKASIVQGNNPIFEALKIELQEYFLGKCQTFSIPLLLIGTDFQQQLWQTLQQILYGKTVNYTKKPPFWENPMPCVRLPMPMAQIKFLF